MTADEFRALLVVEPFQPFALQLPGNWAVEVLRPELASVTQFGCGEVHQPDGSRCIVALEHVTAIWPFDVPITVVEG